jgi:hypothetical protein
MDKTYRIIASGLPKWWTEVFLHEELLSYNTKNYAHYRYKTDSLFAI